MNTPKKRVPFQGTDEEKAYMTGFTQGDLKIRMHGQSIEVRGSSTRQAFIDLVNNLFSPYGKPTVGSYSLKQPNRQDIIFLLDRSFDFLFNKEVLNNHLFFPYFAGFSDAETSFGAHQAHNRHCLNYSVRFTATDYNRAENIQGELLNRNFNATIVYGTSYFKKTPCFYATVSIYRKSDIARLIKAILPFMRHRERCEEAEFLYEKCAERLK